jgi:hypothetical protein
MCPNEGLSVVFLQSMYAQRCVDAHGIHGRYAPMRNTKLTAEVESSEGNTRV